MENSGMAGIDEALTFYPLRVAVLTIADTRTLASDVVGRLLDRLRAAGHEVGGRALVRSAAEIIRSQVQARVDDPTIEVVVTTGGTGFHERDVTGETLRPLFRREMGDFSVLMRQASVGTVGVSTLQSRACAGQVGEAFVFCLPDSRGGCRDAWDAVLRFELDSRYRSRSLAGLVPRLRGLCA